MKLEKLILGNFVSFVLAGTTFGTDPVNTVGIGLYPDTTTYADIWGGWGDVLDASLVRKEENYEDTVPSIYGGYATTDDVVSLQDKLKLSLKCHSKIIHRLVWGLAEEIVDGTEQTPFAEARRYAEGWMNFQQRAQDGADRIIAALYGRVRLDADPKWAKDPTKPAVIFEIIRSPIQSILPDGIIA